MPIKGHFTCLGKAKKTKPKWGIEGVVTTGLTIIIGPPKDSYKTTLAMAFALLIARQEHHVLPKEWKPLIKGPVLVFEAEADAGELKEMCEDGMGCKVPADESIMVCDEPEAYRLDNDDASAQMISWCRERNVAAAIMDPLVNFHELDEKDAAQMVRILRPLRKWSKEEDAMFFLLHHTRKIEDGKQYTANDARGTSAIFGLCDNILTITPGKEPYEILISRKGKKGKPWERLFLLNIWDRVGKRTSESLRSVDKLIIGAVKHGFLTQEAVAQHLNINLKTIKERLVFLIDSDLLSTKASKLVLKHNFKPQDLL